MNSPRRYNQAYVGEYLNHVAFPLGAIGAGMICIEGSGSLSHVSVRNRPELFNEPRMFSALCLNGKAKIARVLAGPVPGWKIFGPIGTGNGAEGKAYGLPRCQQAKFLARFPFATIKLTDSKIPLAIKVTAWNPVTPPDEDDSCLPVAGLEYQFQNNSTEEVHAVYSFHAENFMSTGSQWPNRKTTGQAVRSAPSGFILCQNGSEEKPWDQGAFSAIVDDPDTKVNCKWLRGSGNWMDSYDSLTMVWRSVAQGQVLQADPFAEGLPSPGGSLYVPFQLNPGQEKTIRLQLAWHVPKTNIRFGRGPQQDNALRCDGPLQQQETHVPWYAGAFSNIEAVSSYWRQNYERLREISKLFSDCFYGTNLPDEVVEAIAANLTILKSPTMLRQIDGRLWSWEGCSDDIGCCAGSCTHVWNYAQALPHLFPRLERSLRQTEFYENQDETGHQMFRATLPIRPAHHDRYAAADGQLGGMMKLFRDWRISGDTDWMKAIWPKAKQSLHYCIETWDPEHKGVLVEPHHNTYDIEFWGPDGMCTSIYLGALQAAIEMGKTMGEDTSLFEKLLNQGRDFLEQMIVDGEYFVQKTQWKNLRADPIMRTDPVKFSSQEQPPELLELLRKEGPKYQYGKGCLSDGVIGFWMGTVCGLPTFLDENKVASHLLAVYKYNFRADLSPHVNPQRPTFALGKDAGLLVCSWPKGSDLSLPLPYGNEVWTGIEYQVASHLMMMGYVEKGLEIVRAVRDRYDGRVRNPFDEYECGHWYGRAMSSYALIQGLTGIRYDAVEKVLYIAPRLKGDFAAFLCTASGFGTAGVKDGKPFVCAKHGTIDPRKIEYRPWHSFTI